MFSKFPFRKSVHIEAEDSAPTEDPEVVAAPTGKLAYGRASRFYSTISRQINYELPVTAIILLLLTDVCIYFDQRTTVAWIFYIENGEIDPLEFIIDNLSAECIVGVSSVFAGVIADSYTGKYLCILFGSILALMLTIAYFILALHNSISHDQGVFILISAPLFSLVRGAKLAFILEQVRIPKFESYLSTYTFLIVFAKNFARATSVLLHYLVLITMPVDIYIQFAVISLTIGIIDLILILCVKKLAYHEPIYRGITFKVLHCIFYCTFQKIKYHRRDKDKTWLEYGQEKFDMTVRSTSYKAVKLPVIFLPLIFNSVVRSSLMVIWDYQQAALIQTSYTEFTVTMRDLFCYLSFLMLPVVHYVLRPLMRTENILTNDVEYVSLGYFLTGLSVFFTAVIQMIVELHIGIDYTPRSAVNGEFEKSTNDSESLNLFNYNLDHHKKHMYQFLPADNIRWLWLDKHKNTIYHSENNLIINGHEVFTENKTKKILDTLFQKNAQRLFKRRNKLNKTSYGFNMNFGNEPNFTSNTENDDEYMKVGVRKNEIYFMYPQVILAVLGDCIMLPSLIRFTYINAPRKMRATIASYGGVAEGVGRGIMAYLMANFGMGSDSYVLNIWAACTFTFYLFYLYIVLNWKFHEEFEELG